MLCAYSIAASCLQIRFTPTAAPGQSSHQQLPNNRWLMFQRSSQRATSLAGLCAVIAAGLFWWMLYLRDYSVEYIHKNSSDDLPPMYTLSALWSSLEGSHFFWALILALIIVTATIRHPSSLNPLTPYLSITLAAVMAWMYWMLITFSDPFQIIYPTPPHGLGMNALLQNPYMAIHPPLLFIGYSALVVPYGYAVAALFHGRYLPGWVDLMRTWTLWAWIFLTAGIALGGRWAYVELGWGGYWAWDPVENSSLIPWLLATALVHGLIIQKKMNILGGVNILLAIFAFFFSFFGTFLTRSGLVTSVHSFAQSDIGEVYLIFLAGLLGVSLELYIARASILKQTQKTKNWYLSRELMMVSAMFVLCVFAAIVSLGTLYPIASEIWGGVRVNVHAPYFHTFAPWIGVSLATLMALGALLRYHSQRLNLSIRTILFMVMSTVTAGGVFAVAAGIHHSTGYRLSAQLIGVLLIFGTMSCLWVDLRLRARGLSSPSSGSFLSGLSGVGLWALKNRGYVGGVVAHAGFLIALLGFLGNYRGMNRTVSLEKNVATEVLGHTLEYQGIDITTQDNATLFSAAIAVSERGRFIGMMSPARSRYPTSDDLLHEVAVREGFWQDIYLVLTTPPTHESDDAVVQMYVNPLIKLVWIAIIVMCLGGLISWWPSGAKNKRKGWAERNMAGPKQRQ